MANYTIALLQIYIFINFGLGITFYLNLLLLCFLPQTVNSQISHFKQSQMSQVAYDHDVYHYTHDVQWSCFNNSKSSDKVFDCCKINRILCTENGPSLKYGYCATYDGANLSIGHCDAYFEPSSYNVSHPMYILLPIDLTELNNSVCGPLNRKGLLCSECAAGFGISVTSQGYKCTNCTGVWYAVPLFLVLEFVPVTVFYLTVLTFQISVTSPPMPCFIMYAQIVLYIIDSNELRVQFNNYGEPTLILKFIQTFYGIFYLDFFHYILPPLCLSSKLKPIHIVLLGYITVFYPLFLIFLTWVCVKLHDHNVRVIVWLWRPFHKCSVRLRKRWDRKTDLIDVFITFFIFLYYKFAYLSSTLLTETKIVQIDNSGNRSITSVQAVEIDSNVPHLSNDYFLIAMFSGLLLLVFNILPPLLLILYPTRAFRRCLSKCHINSHTIIVFTDKIQNCYSNGLDGGRDMRSFSGFYFYLRLMFHIVSLIFYNLLETKRGISLGLTFFLSALIIAIARPYHKLYMNIIDVLLLTNIALVCCSGLPILYLLLITPIVGFFLLLLLKIVHYKKFFKKMKSLTAKCCSNLRLQRAIQTTKLSQISESQFIHPTARQPLILSHPTESRYGATVEQNN